MSELLTQLAQLAHSGSATRLYALTINSNTNTNYGSSGLQVEAFAAIEGLHIIGARDIIVLSTNAGIALKTLLGRSATLQISLSDGTRCAFTGLINEAALLGSEGGFARYRVRLVPWPWLLTQSRSSRVWQDKTVIDIIESIFREYSAHAAWQWSSEVAPFMASARTRSYVAQYRESNFDFVSRLLTEEGLSFRIEESTSAPSGHQIVLFADTTQKSACPEDATSSHALGGHGIRFHAGTAREEQDSIQALSARRTLQAGAITLLSYDYKTKTAVTAHIPTHHVFGGKQAPLLESYDSPGPYAYANSAEAERYGQLQMQAHEARNKRWYARSTVRTLRPGTTFDLTQGPLNAAANAAPVPYTVLRVTSIGVNNLPKNVSEGIAELFGPIPQLLEECIASCTAATPASATAGEGGFGDGSESGFGFESDDNNLATVIAQATALGYANRFEAIRADIVWRPVLADGTGLRHNPRPTAFGSQSAIVVGASGETRPNGADEIYCDRLGRVRIQFHWQDAQQNGSNGNGNSNSNSNSNATCWVRVAQRAAGAGMGVQFLPRIGQEVLVQFLEGDIDRPIILGALYNGQGEGGVIPTPGGNADTLADVTVFEAANDHRSSAQGNLAGSNSPTWHGASPDSAGHQNAGAQWGIRSKEFGGSGYNQLLFDDTDNQGRIQLKTTHAGSELNLGHLIHSADNYRGSFRGLGAELRTDAYGAVRAAQGILVSSYCISHSAGCRDPAGDNSAGQALLKQAVLLAKSFNSAATTHKTVGYAVHQGPVKANASILDSQAAPLQALYTATSGMLSKDTFEQAKSDAQDKNTRASDDKVPHSTAPIIGIAARAGLGVVAGSDLQLANGETVSVMSGQDSQFITGNQLRMHTGQAIGMLAGAVKPGAGNIGLQLIAAQHAIDVQAQSDAITIQARDQVKVMSAHGHIDWAAARSISLSTAGGANITIAGGNITVQCPGKITVHASLKRFDGSDRLSYELPLMPKGDFKLKKKFPFSL